MMQHGEASCARRHTGATGSSVGFLSTTVCCFGATRQGSNALPHTAHMREPKPAKNGGPRREAESGSDLLGRRSCSSTAHQSTNASIPSRGKENSSGATTTRPLSISRGARCRSTTPSGSLRDGMLRAVFLFTSPAQWTVQPNEGTAPPGTRGRRRLDPLTGGMGGFAMTTMLFNTWLTTD